MIAALLLIASIQIPAIIADVQTVSAAHEISVLSPEVSLTADARVGSRRTGVFCVSAGKWLWRDIRSEAAPMREAIERGLLQAGLASQDRGATDFGSTVPLSTVRLKATITAIAINSCSEWSGTRAVFNKAIRYRGEIALEVRWQLYSAAEQRILADFSHSSTTTFHAAPSIGTALATGLTANAHGAAQQWPKSLLPIR